MARSEVDRDRSPVDPEPSIRNEPDDQVQITGWATATSGCTLAGQPDLLAVGDPGGDLHGVVPRTTRAGEADLVVAAVVGVSNTQVDLDPLVRPWPRTGRPALIEHSAEQIVDRWSARASDVTEIDEHVAGRAALSPTTCLSPTASGPLCTGPVVRVDIVGDLPEVVAEGVVLLAKIRVGQYVVGLGDLLEPILGPGRLVDVRVPGSSERSIRGLDLVPTRRTIDTQCGVVVGGHQSASLATTTDAGRSSASAEPYPGVTTATTTLAGTPSPAGMVLTTWCSSGSKTSPTEPNR